MLKTPCFLAGHPPELVTESPLHNPLVRLWVQPVGQALGERSDWNELESGPSTGAEGNALENGVLVGMLKRDLGRQHEKVEAGQSKSERFCSFQGSSPKALEALYSKVPTPERENNTRRKLRLSLSEIALFRSHKHASVLPVWAVNNLVTSFLEGIVVVSINLRCGPITAKLCVFEGIPAILPSVSRPPSRWGLNELRGYVRTDAGMHCQDLRAVRGGHRQPFEQQLGSP